MSRTRPFAQIDVFTTTAGLGNPVAVVLDAAGLSDADMQRFARWTNLSETTFVLPPTDPAAADYALRIFTPGGELPFAGHPTLGTCFAWLAAGGQPRDAGCIVQQCAKGLIPIRRDTRTQRLAFAAPPLQAEAPDPTQLQATLQALGLPATAVRKARWLDNGPRWLGLWLHDADTVLALNPDHAALAALGVKVGAAGLHPVPEAAPLIARASREARAFTPPASTADGDDDTPLIEVRAFAAAIGVNEDPVTGSLNASLAQWLMADGDLPAAYIAAQGAALGRDGRVHLQRDTQGQLWVGGHCTGVVQGQVQI